MKKEAKVPKECKQNQINKKIKCLVLLPEELITIMMNIIIITIIRMLKKTFFFSTKIYREARNQLKIINNYQKIIIIVIIWIKIYNMNMNLEIILFMKPNTCKKK
jgi:hypothetical protein